MKSQAGFSRFFASSLTAALALLLTGAVVPFCAQAQPAGHPMAGPPGPRFDAAMTKLFGKHKDFSATLEFETDGGDQGPAMKVDGKMAQRDGKVRFEMDLSTVHSPNLPPQAMERMKQMGMDKVITISDPVAKRTILVYPNMNAYVEMPAPDAANPSTNEADFKSEVTPEGSETLSGHPCDKNKVTVTGPDGSAHHFTVWNATDLDKFPLKIQTSENGSSFTMLFKDPKLEKPDAAEFSAPSDFKKYDNMMALMMSRMGSMQQH